MKYKKLISFLAFFLAVLSVYGQNPFILKSGEPVTIACGNSEEEVVHTALNLLNRDVESVFSTRIIVTPESKKGMIIVGTIGQSDLIDKAGVDLSPIKNKKEAFLLTVSSTGKLVIAGSDKRGTAYGVMELSRLIGVSPWEWWADAIPAKKEIFQLPASYRNMQFPSVEYRGIFINDEDWGLTPWSWQTYEPSNMKGQIGPKTHERIFELMLRLRANTFWPAMHGCSVPFYFTPGNKEVADKFGIFIGTSHCEPMMRNTNGEWKRDGVGEYDYVHNSAHVLSFWEQRVKEVAELDNLYTLGMRGVHDGAMNGAKTIEEQKAVLTKVLRDQRDLLTKYVNKDVTQVPQVFIPYKEVLDVYHAGLQVPDEVTLMWCDDNYGYIRHFPTAEERARKGGNGVYYHVSYWGRPHDYLWLGTAHPSLVYQQMSLAYERGIQKMWILNVGDIKPAEYQVELFLDMAWNLEAVKQQGVVAHQRQFLEREFGLEVAAQLQPVMQEAYRLAYIRKPEFMGWNQVELDKKKYTKGWSPVKNTDFSLTEFGGELDRYLESYEAIKEILSEVEPMIPQERKDAFFAQIKYPVFGAAAMSTKMLEAQRARCISPGSCDTTLWTRESQLMAACAKSIKAYQEIRDLTDYYNNELADGKWKYSMCHNPRDLYVFYPPEIPIWLTDKEIEKYASFRRPKSLPLEEVAKDHCIVSNACDYTSASKGVVTIQSLGHSMNAVSVPKGKSITFEFDCLWDGEAILRTAVIPTQPNDKGDIRFSVSIDGEKPRICSIKEPFRSEGWKQNVLRGQAVRETGHQLTKGKHTLSITALDDHVLIDQWMIDFKPDRMFYVFPVQPTY